MKVLNYNWIHRTIIVCAFAISGLSQATTMVVDDPNVEVNINGLCSLAEAIIHANEDFVSSFDCPAGSGADTIQLTTDVTLGLMALDSHATYGFTGTPALTSTITIDGMGHSIKRSSSCTPNGTLDNGEFRIFRNAEGGNLTLENIMLENGCADGAGLYAVGGAILSHSFSILTLNNSIIKSNRSYDSGGAIFNTSAATLNMTTSQFIDNIANGSGGAVANDDLATINVNASEFTDNHGSNGGAIYNANGAIIDLLSNSTFKDNVSTADGGAIMNTSANISTAFINRIENTTFSGNSATNGGAIANYLSSINGMNNLTFVDNNAALSGAAVWNEASSTIGSLSNSLFKNNSDVSGSECTNVMTGTNNLSDRITGSCAFANLLTASTVGPLANNGGDTMTHALLPGSEAIDAAISGTAMDQRGYTANSVRDIGAFEAFVPIVVAPEDITIEATGVLTTVNLGVANVTDLDNPGLLPSADQTGPFALGEHTITWTAIDTYGFIGEDIQTVTITDTSKPVITLNGPNPLILNIGDTYIDPQATVIDNYDGTVQINSTTPVNTLQIDQYQAKYNYTDSNGNVADEVIRTVLVMPTVIDCVNAGYDTTTDFNATVTFAPELQLAIYCANENNLTTDTINLNADIYFDNFYGVSDATFGQTATPSITTPIIIDGKGYSIQRESFLTCQMDGILDNSEFRLIRIENTGDLTLENLTIVNGCTDGFFNSHGSYGGGIYNEGNLIINNSQFKMNKAQYSAGIDNYGVISEIKNSTFYENESVAFGGSIYNNPNGIINSIKNSTFSHNEALGAAAIYIQEGTINSMLNNTFVSNVSNSNNAVVVNSHGTITNMNNNLFVGNQNSNTVANCYMIDGTITGSNNMSDSTAQGISGSNCIDGNGSNVIDQINLDPNTVDDLADNGCASPSENNTCVMTHALLMGSQAIDASDSNATEMDQREFYAFATRRDIGAYEYNGGEDSTSPVITLNGSNPLILNIGSTYIDPQATVTDNYDSTIQINGVGTVDSNKIGNYQINYNHTDRNGNVAEEVIRTVIVLPTAIDCVNAGYDTSTDFDISVSYASELQLAIYCANENNLTTDTINLNADIYFDNYYGVSDAISGQTATPNITSSIIINGKGYSIQRENSLTCQYDGIMDNSEFRLMSIENTGDLSLENLTLANGCADGSGIFFPITGGGINNGGNLAIINSQFIMNKSIQSGGIDNYGVISEIKNSTFYANEGGAILNYSSAIINEIKNSTFYANEGGAILNYSSAIINEIKNSTFSGNMADDGAAILNIGTINSMNSNTFYNNHSRFLGVIENLDGTITNMNNNLFIKNQSPDVFDCYMDNGSVSGSNNMSDYDAQGISGSGSNCIDGNGSNVIDQINLDPNTVDDLADNGCASPSENNTCVMTHALLMGSQAIDAGNANAITFDQRGFAANNVRDIGAFEYNGSNDLIFKEGFE